MLILRNIVITLLLLTLLAISVVGLMIEAPPVFHWTPERLHQLGHSVVHIMRPGLLLFWLWWVLFLGTLLVFFITVARPRRRMKIEVQMGGGRVVIMDAAIKRYVRNALAELHGVTIKKMDLREHRGQVTTDIYADVRTRENLPTLERRIISKVRNALAEDLGITNLGDVHVFIKSFEVTGRPAGSDPHPEPEHQPEPTPVEQPSPAEDIVLNRTATVPSETALPLTSEPHDDATGFAVAEPRDMAADQTEKAAPITFAGEEAATIQPDAEPAPNAADAPITLDPDAVITVDGDTHTVETETESGPDDNASAPLRPWERLNHAADDDDQSKPGGTPH